jgi:hypothetical protein
MREAENFSAFSLTEPGHAEKFRLNRVDVFTRKDISTEKKSGIEKSAIENLTSTLPTYNLCLPMYLPMCLPCTYPCAELCTYLCAYPVPTHVQNCVHTYVPTYTLTMYLPNMPMYLCTYLGAYHVPI